MGQRRAAGGGQIHVHHDEGSKDPRAQHVNMRDPVQPAQAIHEGRPFLRLPHQHAGHHLRWQYQVQHHQVRHLLQDIQLATRLVYEWVRSAGENAAQVVGDLRYGQREEVARLREELPDGSRGQMIEKREKGIGDGEER